MKKENNRIINLENFVGIILATLPLYLIRFIFLGVPLNLLEIMILVALGWWLWEEKFVNPDGKNFFKNNQRSFILIGIVLLNLLLSSFFSGNLKAGLGIIKGWFILPLVLVLITINLFQGKKIRALRFFYGGAVGIAVLSLVGFFLGQNTYDGRLQGFFNSPNYLAMYLAPAVIIGIVLWEENRKKYTLSLAIILLTVYATYSFAAWAALLAVLVGVFLSSREKREKNKKLLGSILILAGLFFFLQIKTDKLHNLLKLEPRSSLASRIMIWQSAGKIIADNPFWGIGPGNFQEKYLAYQKHFPPYLEWAVPHPHNFYLAVYLYAGIIGLGAFMLLIISWLKKILPQRAEKIVLISLGIIAYFLLHGLVDTTYFKNDLAIIFWLAFFLPL